MKKQPRVPKHSHTDMNEASINPETTELYDASQITTGTLDGDRMPAISTTKKGAVPATGAPANHYLRDDGNFTHPAQSEINGLEETATPRFAGLGIGVAGAVGAVELDEGVTIGDKDGAHLKFNKAMELLESIDMGMKIGTIPARPGVGGAWSTSYDSAATAVYCAAIYKGKLYVGTKEGLIYVYDGSSWSTAKNFSPATKVKALCVFGDALYACGYLSSSGVITYVYKTTDGTTWETVWTHNWGYIVEGILSMAVNDLTLYVGLTQSGVYYSTDGAIFSSASLPSGYGANGLCSINGKIYAATNNIVTGGTRIYRLNADGSWTNVHSIGTGIELNCIYTWNGKLYAGADNGEIYYSEDGTTWATAVDLGAISVLGFYEHAGYLLAMCDNGTVYKSADGLAWSSFYASGEDAAYSAMLYGSSLYLTTGAAGKVQVYTDTTYIPGRPLEVTGNVTFHGQLRPGDAPGVEGDIMLSGGADHPGWLARGKTGQYVAGVTDGKPIYQYIPASDVVVTPTGGIAADDVQEALAELDGEKGPAPISKTDTGDPAGGIEGQVCVNTFDKTIKIYGGGAWCTVATWT